jgi:glycosyltransferase involved in cell wall biosynthesis
MCGLCVVTTNNHDTDMFIENGVNGFTVDSEKEASDILMLLYNNKTLAMEVGKRGRASAKEYFHINRYLQDWENVLKII